MSCRAESEAEPKAFHFPHDADIGICGVGPTLEAAFGQGALAMTGPAKIELKEAAHAKARFSRVFKQMLTGEHRSAAKR